MKTIKKIYLTIGAALIVVLFPFNSKAQEAEKTRINQAAEVLNDFKKMKENIPHQLFDQTEAIVIIPKMINAGFGIGGKRGKGVAIVKLADGKWSDPAFITLTGGSIGLQAGVQSVDLVLFFKHRVNVQKMDKGSFTIGGNLSATAGPVGRNASASTDYKLQAEIYSYSRSRGVFAGITLDGASLSIDKKANKRFYGTSSSPTVIMGKSDSPSESVAELKNALNVTN